MPPLITKQCVSHHGSLCFGEKTECTNKGLTEKGKMQQLHLNQVGPYVKTDSLRR